MSNYSGITIFFREKFCVDHLLFSLKFPIIVGDFFQKFCETPPQTGMQMSNIYEERFKFLLKTLIFPSEKNQL